MKTSIIKSLVALCASVAVTAMGQATFTWTNAAGGDIATAANWSPNGTPQPITGDPNTLGIYGDEMLWDGVTTTDHILTANTGQGGFSSGLPEGLRIRLSSNQVNAVTIRSVVPTSAGTRLNSITIEPGAGAFHMGDPTTVNVWDFLGGASNPATHTWINDSTNAATVHPNVRHRLGAGGAHTFDFGGSGNWIVNNYFRNFNNAATLVAKSGTGTMTWTGTNVGSAVGGSLIASPLTVNDGTLILKSSDLLGAQTLNVNGGLLKYDIGAAAGTLSGNLNGAGALEVASGTLTLSGNGTFTGGFTLSGGTLFVNRAENFGVSGPLGVGGLISFTGGALGFSAINSFDYSARFSTANNQNYQFDSGGQTVSFATGLSSSGGTVTKLGSGTVVLAGPSTYTGVTTVSVGRLVFQGTKSGSANITVADGAALGITENGSQITPNTLTLGTTASATLEFNNVSSTTTAPLAANTIAAGGPINVNINSGTFNTIGAVYPLFSWTTGTAPAVNLALLNGGAGSLSTNGNTIQLTITGTPFTWTGLTDGVWDLTTGNNWVQSGSPVIFGNGLPTVFDDTATGVTNITVGALVQPGSITINNVTNAYSIASSGANNIGGTASLNKINTGVAALSGGANTYTGITTISGGTLSVGGLANGAAPSDIGAASSAAANVVLNGGTLQYTGSGASIDRLFTISTANGTIDASGTGPLALTNSGLVARSGSGARTLTLTGADQNDNTLAGSLTDNFGATSLSKSGDGKWVLTGTNTYTGATTVSAGTLQVGAGGDRGTLGTGSIVNNSRIVFNRTGTLTVNSVISGVGAVTNLGTGTVILAANNTYVGDTTIAAGTLQVGNGGASGSLASDQPIINDGTLIFNTTGSFTYLGGGVISGTGNVIVRGNNNKIKAIGLNTYTGWTQIDSGATFQPTEGNSGQLLSSVVTNNGTLRFVAQDPRPAYAGAIVGSGRVQMGANNFNAGSMTFTGTNTYTGGTFIGDNELIFGDGITPGAGSFVGNVTFINNFDTPDDNLRMLTFNRPDDFTFSGNITTNFTSAQNNQGRVRQMGPGVLTLTGNNNYASGTVIDAGTIQVGNGGTSGSIGTGTVTNNGTLIWNRSDNVTFGGVFNGIGNLVKSGAGVLTLTATNFTGFTGITTVSNGILNMASSMLSGDTNGYPGSLAISGGTFVLGDVSKVGVLELSGILTINSGTIVATLNTSLAQSNTFYSALAGLTYNGGTLKLINAGPQLVVGQKFTIFSQAVTGVMPVVTPGFTVQNDLAVDGSVTVTAVLPPPTITSSVTGNQLNLSWPAAWTGGVRVQAQTNSLAVGVSGNWVTIPGTDASNTYSVTINPANPTVFYRLIAP
jgi:fibronectin-binding autotransporter adhesin